MIHTVQHIEAVARLLRPLGETFVFLGGAVVPLLVDRPETLKIRPTKDVDVIVDVLSRRAYDGLQQRLRDQGFQHDRSENAPICRWVAPTAEGPVTVDVMPIEETILGFSNPWYPHAFETARPLDPDTPQLRLITAPAFLATKLQAFLNRGKGDYYASPDLEDIITLLEGRAQLVSEVQASAPPLQDFVALLIADMLEDLLLVVAGHVSQPEQAFIVIERLRRLADL